MEPVRKIAPGLLVCGTIAAAAGFLADHYGGPVMLFALLLGLAFHFMAEDTRAQPGIDFAARTILRVGVALLGLRVMVSDITALGPWLVVVIGLGVVTTILFGILLARIFNLNSAFGALTGGAVAICGASAALAISAVLPASKDRDRDASFAVIGVTTLSTIAMIIYPIITGALAYDDQHAGLFIGATIHDVAQVIGAGYSISPQAGDAATITKLLRVALLLPVVVIFTLAWRHQGPKTLGPRPALLPWFLSAFAALVLVNSLVTIPETVKAPINETSRFFLVTAVAAIGVKTSLKSMGDLGLKPVLLMVGETLYLALLSMGLIALV